MMLIDTHAAKQMTKGLLTYVPGLRRVAPRKGTGGSTSSASYCYGVWLKHLALLGRSGMEAPPRTVAELGPGQSIGSGIAALLSGADRYLGLDLVRHADTEMNLRVLDEMVDLMRARAPRPVKGWPDFDAELDEHLFPSRLLSDERLADSLREDRVTAIREAIRHPGGDFDGICVDYVVPWSDENVAERSSIDLVFSHDTLEYVESLDDCYRLLAVWLRPGGWMSHQIDLSAHGTSGLWNGFRGYDELTWRLIRGNRPFGINREPASAHLAAIERSGFATRSVLRRTARNKLPAPIVASRWRGLSAEDLTTSGLFVQALRHSMES